MKYVVVLPDGVSDQPVPELGGKTPLEVAKHPNMDWIAREGITGWCATIPNGLNPGSDVGCMSVFGYDPRKHYTGRAPLEAARQGIVLKDQDVAFRCNVVTIQDGTMVDYSAGHIETEDAKALVQTVDQSLGGSGRRFYPGVSYRHLLVIADGRTLEAKCTPPHDISGKPVEAHLPKGSGSEILRELMAKSQEVLKRHPVNARRIRDKKPPVTSIWLWGQGKSASFPSFESQFGVRGSVISAVDIVKGLGRLVGLDVIEVPGATGYFDTNYKGKAEYALASLKAKDFVLVHVESTDEAGHMGDVKLKIKAIEDVDRLVVGTLLEGLRKLKEPFGILVVCDHPTSTALKTHIPDPVPFALYTPGGPKDGVSSYSESAIRASTKRFDEGYQLMEFFIRQGHPAGVVRRAS